MSGGIGSALRRRRRAARLAAVQALYQLELGGGDAESVLRDFARRRLHAGEDPLTPAEIDGELFDTVVRGVARHAKEIDARIEAVLDRDRRVARLEVLVRLILRAGTLELMERTDIDPPVTIKEYVEVAGAFFEGPEPAFVNGVLDALARRLRGDEMKEVGKGTSTSKSKSKSGRGTEER